MYRSFLTCFGVPQLERIYRDKDDEAMLLRDLQSLEEGVSDRALEPAAMVHMRWLVSRHATRWPLTQITTQLRHLGVAHRSEIYARIQSYSKQILYCDSCLHYQKDSLVLFPSFLSVMVGCAYTSVGIVSLTDAELDDELQDLRTEMGMEEQIDDDDGFKFGNAVFNLVMKVVEATSTEFKRKDSSRSGQTRRGTWRKSMIPSKWVRPLYARHDAVTQASLEQLASLDQHGGKEDKIGGSKPDVDEDLKSLFDPVAQERVTYVKSCLESLVKKHSDRLHQLLKDPIKSRSVKKATGAGGRLTFVNLSDDKVTSIYSLRIVAMRCARRRILGILNVFAIVDRQMALSVALLDSSSANSSKVMSEMMEMQHSLSIDRFDASKFSLLLNLLYTTGFCLPNV